MFKLIKKTKRQNETPRGSKRRQEGFITAIELLVLICCVLCCTVIAWAAVGPKLNAEYIDVATAVGSLEQSYTIAGMAVSHDGPPDQAGVTVAEVGGSGKIDQTFSLASGYYTTISCRCCNVNNDNCELDAEVCGCGPCTKTEDGWGVTCGEGKTDYHCLWGDWELVRLNGESLNCRSLYF